MKQKSLRILSALVAMALVLSVCFSALAYSTIPYGSESTQVKTLQKALKSKGYYSGTVDGKYGGSTYAAVVKFQKAIGISADGKAGNLTLTALYDGITAANYIDSKKAHGLTASKGTLYYGLQGDKVKTLEKLLKKAGYFKGGIDGKFGEMTLIAVKRFQLAKGLKGDGYAGAQTMKLLKEATGS
jgi:peptidoglycan hydrolase-like protein with peptidoglycan-binding domain